MNNRPNRKTDNLRIGPTSIPGARYFITICSKDRKPNLTQSDTAKVILETWRLQHANSDYAFSCGTIMPDHIHFLLMLGSSLSLGQCIIKFKAKTKAALSSINLSWQRDFYDHRIRFEKSIESFARYIFLNPYRKSLITATQGWSHWHCNKTYKPEFLQHLTDDGYPQPEWIINPDSVSDLIDIDMIPGNESETVTQT